MEIYIVYMTFLFQLHYTHDTVERLKGLYKMLVSPPTMDGDEDNDADSEEEEDTTWNLNVAMFKRVRIVRSY